MQRLHNELEQTFLEINKVIPFDRNDNDVYSPRFVFILQDASRQVDGMLKLIYRRFEPHLPASATAQVRAKIARSAKPGFLDYYTALNHNGMLSVQKLALKEDTPRTITPFVLTQNNTPQWWQAYNDTKHDLPEGESFGKLGFAIDALGAVAALHDIAQVCYVPGLLTTVQDGTKWLDYEDRFMSDYTRTKNKEYRTSIIEHVGERMSTRHKSSIFYYLMQYR